MPQRIWARYSTSLLLVAIFVLAVGLRFWNIGHDSDLAASVSSDAPEKFNQARQLAREGTLPSEPDKRYLLYNQPLFVIRSYAAIWKITALLGLPTDDQRMRVGFTAYVILFSLGTLVLVFLIGRLVFGESAPALLASLLLAVFPVNVMGSLYVKEDIPLMFWFTAAMLALCALVKSGRKGLYLWSGALIGLAVGTKYTGLLLLPIFLLAHLLVVWNAPKAERLRALFAWQSIAALGLGALTFALFNPQIITEWPDFRQGFLFQVQYAGSGHRDGTVIRGIDYWWTFYLRYAILPGLTLPATLFGLAGLLLALVKRNRLLIVLSVALLLAYFQVESSPAKPFPFFARYLHMAYPLLALLAAYAFAALWRRLRDRTFTRMFAMGVGLLLVLVPLSTSAILAGGAHPDTRELATRWMADNLPHGARIALGSRTYSPQHLNDLFDVRYDDSIHTRSLQRLKDAKFEYVVVNSFQYDRYRYSLASSAVSQRAVEGYAAFERGLTLVRVFEPQFPFQTYGEHNPVIRIYKMP
ncbi:MAG: glycosyltransferase family 39 protein [Roseiflexaceae bacterium]